ncbi:Ribosome-releasing factor 2, mitochondrial [Balamuthia mandrillaris]
MWRSSLRADAAKGCSVLPRLQRRPFSSAVASNLPSSMPPSSSSHLRSPSTAVPRFIAASSFLCRRRFVPLLPSVCASNGTFFPVVFRNKSSSSSLSSKADSPKRDVETALRRVRNIGIIAHVDAGKTTTSERMLYYAGVVPRAGNVDDGTTVMDFMRLEQERGITINSAAITFNWGDTRINLIDTPGHVDFMFEVERAVRVLDGAVAVLDGVAGVQAQTETVWGQALRYKVPVLAFVNKMDREGATLEKSVNTMKDRLRARPLLVQLPVGEGPQFKGVVDLVTNEVLVWEQSEGGGDTYTREPLATSQHATEKLLAKAKQARENLVEQVADLDDELMERVLEGEGAVSPEALQAALRRIVLAAKAVPVLCGSSLKNKGVQPLMDAVLQYLPSPMERPPVQADVVALKRGNQVESLADRHVDIYPSPSNPLCALAFKVVHDHQRGLVVYFRVYSGKLRSGVTLFNSTRGVKERISKLMSIHAEEMIEVPHINTGDIGAAVGLKETCTGDTVTVLEEHTVTTSKKQGDKEIYVLKGINVPPPVFFCSVEPESLSGQKALDQALSSLQREDPSFVVSVDPDSGQTLMSGMGELHLDILKDRILTHYKVPIEVGKMRISYRTTINQSLEEQVERELDVGGSKQRVQLTISVEPRERGAGNLLENEIPKEAFAAAAPVGGKQSAQALIRGLEQGVRTALQSSTLFGFPVEDVHVTLRTCDLSPESTEAGLRACAHSVTRQLIGKAEPRLLEPVMKVSITVDEEHAGPLLSDLTGQRRGVVRMMESDLRNKIITAELPLKEMVGYSTQFRSLTRGKGSFTMEFLRYGDLMPTQHTKLLQELRGGF